MRRLEEKIFLLLIAAASLAFAWILWPFFGAIFWGTVIAIVFAPLFRRLSGPMRQSPSIAALATILIVIVIVILPLTAITSSLIQEATNLYDRIHSGELNFSLYFNQIWDAMPSWIQNMMSRLGLTNLGAVQEKLAVGLRQGSQFLATQILSIGQFTFQFIINLCVMLYLLFYLLRDGDALCHIISRAIPLRTDQQRALFTKFTTAVRATVQGGIFVAILQGMLGSLIFWFLGIHTPLLWGVIMAFLSLLPAIGASLVWLPVAIYLLATGDVWQGLTLIAFGTLIIGLVDNFMRPVLVGKDTRLPNYVVLISTLGGLQIFGLNGLIIGPAIAAMFTVVWEIFSTSRQGHRNDLENP